jgi:NADH-quinone oxidoreductase subunit L
VGAAVLIGAAGLVAGWRATLRRRTLPAADAAEDTGLARVLYRKFYVDEIYDALIVRPVIWLSRLVLWKGIDQGVVDGAAVNGTAKLSRGLGWLGSRLQTGQVGVYVVLFLVGALWVLHAVVR